MTPVSNHGGIALDLSRCHIEVAFFQPQPLRDQLSTTSTYYWYHKQHSHELPSAQKLEPEISPMEQALRAILASPTGRNPVDEYCTLAYTAIYTRRVTARVGGKRVPRTLTCLRCLLPCQRTLVGPFRQHQSRPFLPFAHSPAYNNGKQPTLPEQLSTTR